VTAGPLLRAGLALALCASLLAGCASTARLPELPPQPGAADVQALIRAEDALDARYQVVTDRPFLQVDLRHRYAMADYHALGDEQARRDFIRRFLHAAGALNQGAVTAALARVPAAAITRFAATHALTLGDGEPRAALGALVARDDGALLAAELARVDALANTIELDHYWRALTGHVEASIMQRGRLARRLLTAPAVPLIEGWIAYHNWHDFRGALTPDFRQAVMLTPGSAMTAPADIDPADWALLARHAPLVVQETADGSAWPAEFDHFGTVALTGPDTSSAMPAVDSGAPALYAFVDSKPLQGRAVRQLGYVLWYPRHPKMKGFDPEAGPLDGWTIRVSLDAQDTPVLVESVSNCGCYYKIFPADALERKAAAAWTTPLQGKTWHLEQDVPRKFDAVVPETVSGLDASAQSLVVYFSAGHHQLVTVRSRAQAGTLPTAAVAYTLRDYAELEHLPLNGHAASLFGMDGLVRGAHRDECNLLTPSGLYHAGHPRQRETQMIYFDEADFDDPQLLERYLRLPPQAFGDDA